MADTINRQAAIDAVNKICDRCGEHKKYNGVMCGTCNLDGVGDIIEDLPSAQSEHGMVADLISFIEREKDKENRTLADWTVQWILEDIIAGKCKITGSATDHKKKKMYVEFSFYQEE